MIWNFSFNAENQKKYDEVTANIRRLQTEMGIEPMTLEERAAAYKKRKAEEEKIKTTLGVIRPLPKWKV